MIATLAFIGGFARLAAAAPLDPLAFPVLAESYDPGPVTIDTDALQFGPHLGVLHQGVAVFTFGALTLDETVTIVGTRPVALLTTGDLEVRTPLDLGSADTTGGPGGHDAVPGGHGLGPGPGEAFDVGTGGAFCGDGGDADDGARDGGTAYGVLLDTLEGGSSGGSSEDGTPASGGGGAIELGAIGVLTVAAPIHADAADAEDNPDDYAGGGGAGGGILLHGGPGSACTSAVTANGGDGGDANNKGGGGGGAGCLVLLGVDAGGCVLESLGGAGGPLGWPGQPSAPIVLEDPDQDGDGVSLSDQDCNDNDANTYPGAPETPCDGIDQDCDGVDACVDVDQDGHAPPLDCDDLDGSVHPGAEEDVADGVDSDCDGFEACFEDADGDGLGEPGGAIVMSEVLTCLAAGVSPNQDDLCIGHDDRVDGDGDGAPDGCDDCPDDPLPYEDTDGDGVCDTDDLCGGDDAAGDTDGDGLCDDVDQCDGVDTDGDGTCDDTDQCPGWPDYEDSDGDGLADGCDPCPGDPNDACGGPAGGRDPDGSGAVAVQAAGCGCSGGQRGASGWIWLLAPALLRIRRRRDGP
jgi:hypothetical protein